MKPAVRKLEDLGAAGKRQVVELAPVEARPRVPVNDDQASRSSPIDPPKPA